MLSGFTTGEFFGDTAWVTRAELGRPFSIQLNPGTSETLVLTPYVFAASGERDIFQPTAAEIGTVHISNYGLGTRFNLPSWAQYAVDLTPS